MAWGLAGCGQVPSLLWTCETWPGGAGHPPWAVPGAAAWERSGPRPREGSGNLGARRSGREQAPAGPGAQTAKARGGHRPTAVPQSQRSSCPRPLPPGRVRPAWPSAGGERSRSVSAPAAPAPRRRRWESAGRSPQAPPQLTAASAAASERPGPAVLRPRVPASPVAHPAPSSPMEPLLRAELRTTTLRAFGSPGAGCISEGRAYDTDAGPVFVKVNRRSLVRAPAPSQSTPPLPARPGAPAENGWGERGLEGVGRGRRGLRGGRRGPVLGPGAARGLAELAPTCTPKGLKHFLRTPGFYLLQD